MLLLCLVPLIAAAVQVGQPPPEIRLDRLLPEQPVGNATLAALKGKAVVLDFWATWCGPCLADIPQWNGLVKQFAGRPVVFLAVTPERPEVVEAFLKRRPIHGWVGIANTTGLLEAYRLAGVGHKVLVRADGTVAAVATSGQLTAGAIEELLTGAPVRLPQSQSFEAKLRSDDAGSAPPVANVIIWPTTSVGRGGGNGRDKDELMFRASTVRSILSVLYRVPGSRVIGEPVEDTARYDAWVALPGAGPEAFESFAKTVVCAGLHVTAEKETRETDVYVLIAPSGKPAALTEIPATGGVIGGTVGGALRLSGPIPALVATMERILSRPVIDETGLNGAYDIRLPFDERAPETLVTAVEGLGLSLTTARRPIGFLVVRPAR